MNFIGTTSSRTVFTGTIVVIVSSISFFSPVYSIRTIQIKKSRQNRRIFRFECISIIIEVIKRSLIMWK